MSAKVHQRSPDDHSLARLLQRAPKLSSPRRARDRMTDILAKPDAVASGLAALMEEEPVRTLLEGIADHSPYLWHLAQRDLARLTRILILAPDESLRALLTSMRDSCAAARDDIEAMRVLRKAKQEAALLIAIADIGGVWNLIAVTGALTNFADAVIASALSFLLRQEASSGRLRLRDAANPERDCGLVVLALGKHGAGELNYSSDTDIVVLFDLTAQSVPDMVEPASLFVRLTKSLARLMQERTGDGYVLRVDLRLRPDPGSTAIAISTHAARDYYESVGQNWERAAMIKARPIAGDIALGDSFLAELAPFIWRKYFDYAAIADIHAMKRQIHAVRGHAEVAIAGHNVKLGRGGIREIEFFVQTQQLIFGGKRPQLRGSRTLDMLVALAHDGWVKKTAVRDLTAAYLFLREIEHRLQMVEDEQTQRLPSTDDALQQFARFCGFAGVRSFSNRLMRHLRNVELHYARLFEAAPGLDSALGSLVFTGVVDDPATIITLRNLGFHDPARAAETVRGWHFGRRAAVQSARAREVLTELVPGLLEAFAGSGEPDTALATFDTALTHMPAAVELMSILRSSKELRELFADILGGAPRLAEVISMRPHVLDAAIDPSLSGDAGRGHAYAKRMERLLLGARSAEDFLDASREIVQEEKFLIGVRTLARAIDPIDAGRAYSELAESVVDASLQHTEAVFQLEYGCVPGGRCIVLGMGKLGSREMTAASDIDLILIYDFDETQPESDGPRRLHALQYYARLTQRLISTLTVATRRGPLYEVDMRLRPSGNKGPVATQWRAFAEYQITEAETWEHMALTRARVICGDASLSLDVQRTIRAVLTSPLDEDALRRDVYDMRRLIAQERGENNPWDLKLAAGGLIDIEFLAQYFSLRYAAMHSEILDVDTNAAIANATGKALLTTRDGELLRNAHDLYGAVTQMMRLAINGPFDPKSCAAGVLRRIAAVAGIPDFARLERDLIATRAEVRALFEKTLGP